ncbi:hypothetical protein IP90_03059 [Luteimonas cucumeris]|uniref:Uncharacterized protein n=1 Tax=Luteimonas cucumeris TaxID=985012 RepID=A0A562KWH0_9GAMM|nr:ankyrin repeat domain-containing protein [Luteimonas cucumeris]TWH99751.1 hypothetical protein IP90_03059 [Luteimonas cucumeris]
MRAALIHAMVLLLALSATACRGDTMDAKQVFTDPQVAALATAAARGDAADVREQIRQGADPDAQGDKGMNVLQYALAAQNPDGLKALLDNGADPSRPGLGGSTVIHNAAITDDAVYLEILLAHRADPDAPHGVTGAAPLASAAGPRTDKQFRLLLSAGADPDRADRTGNTPLHAAAMINAGAHVLALLKAGANPRAKNAQGQTFQAYYFKLPAERLGADARQERSEVVAWLREQDVALEAGAG